MTFLILTLLLAICVKGDLFALTPEPETEFPEEVKIFKRKTVGVVQSMGDSIEEVNTKSGVAAALFEGDIVLSKSSPLNHAYEYIAESLLTDKETETSFEKAAKLWMDDTCINFTEYKPKKMKTPSHYLLVIKGDGCSSDLGRAVDGGPQYLSLGKGCGTIGHAAHEIGHALGFFHTHTRHDRDQYITVDETNIESDWDKQFKAQTESTNNNYNLAYDYGSVMHYGATSVSKTKKSVMEAKDPNYTETMGSDIISFYDLLMMNRLYNCDELKAEKEWKTLEAELDGSEADEQRDGFMRCNYWIKAPDDKKVEVKIVELRDMDAVDGCKHAGVEIKTHSDKRLTGYSSRVIMSDYMDGHRMSVMFRRMFEYQLE
ncbi:astacin, partial [Teladorsagia circumcincta]